MGLWRRLKTELRLWFVTPLFQTSTLSMKTLVCDIITLNPNLAFLFSFTMSQPSRYSLNLVHTTFLSADKLYCDSSSYFFFTFPSFIAFLTSVKTNFYLENFSTCPSPSLPFFSHLPLLHAPLSLLPSSQYFTFHGWICFFTADTADIVFFRELPFKARRFINLSLS